MTTPTSELIDPEFEALCAGLKPAVRVTVDPAHADALAERFRKRHNLCVARAGHDAVLGARARAVLYLAQTRETAEQLCALEAAILPGQRRGLLADEVAVHRAMGLLLGFPPCCVEAFVALARTDGGGYSDHYVFARAAWVARPDPLLNHLLLGSGLRLVSFFPCRYDCPAAARFAHALLEVLRARHGHAAADAFARALARAAAIGPRGERALVTLAPDNAITHAEPLRDPRGGALHPDDDAFARALVGARVSHVDGTVDPAPPPPSSRASHAPWPPPVVVPFDAGARDASPSPGPSAARRP